ncbi:Fanconi anemia group M protein isoform X2 [Syngnathoides biaculeatus]|uniref:Fanconi anemia group M protein isoform X2 n=1 Tax=Syngnathoides biaculeatus TaxID=300417 RepID=UPI002ADE153E|nr:Fanconi anemia group M protein isoform X2 [Syngnathoides biaculeatus]
MSASSNQRTLFQTWGASAPPNNVVRPQKEGKKTAGRRKATQSATVRRPSAPNSLWPELGSSEPPDAPTEKGHPTQTPKPDAYEEEDDDLMVIAVTEAESNLQHDNGSSFQKGRPMSPTPSPGTITYPDFPGFDSSSAAVWIYPTNYPLREYQLNISKAALFQNTLVCLPTGLGKTFIAAVVMYNFYRWYPSGKIVFMAPTKPLVAQQIEACYKVMGIPQGHMAELTGSTAANRRQEVWRSKRVFFLTPQVMMNDLSRDTCPARQVKCLVIDEAHKALGNHAYCQVIRQLSSQTLQFRVLALSATPGGDIKSVQCVVDNLLIAHIELRSEESPDILAHTHQRSVEKMVVPLGEALAAHQARYLQVLEKFMSRLVHNRVMAHKDLQSLSKYQLILARDQFRKNPPIHIKGPQQGVLEGDFALCISMYHGYELLMQMGLRSLFFYVQGIMDGSREMSRARNELQRTPTFMELYHEMEAKFGKQPGADEAFIYGHPKLQKLEEVVLQHFQRLAQRPSDNNGSDAKEVSTRVMIFSSFRDSVQEIASMLDRHRPLIRVMTFMGQASAGKGVKGFTQKEQLEVVNRFRQGGFNTLVSTCVGEEGLDIGEVDLIVCFDAQKNPIRLVQRMGRTGRKRQGRIVVILAEGREERTYNQSQSNKRSLLKSILGNKSGFHMYPNNPRMLPDCITPTLHKMHITCGQFDHKESNTRSSRGRRSHAQSRASLIHPQNLISREGAASGGFLSSTEYSVWASTMRLAEDEAQPILRQSSCFMSLPHDETAQDDVPRGGTPVRELSLWEWRHWQHRALPTHVVDHSLRCQHFTKVMQLVDGMREEHEEDCSYERELAPYLNKADACGFLKTVKKNTSSKPVKQSVSGLETQRSDDQAKNAQEQFFKPNPHAHLSVEPQLENDEPAIVIEDVVTVDYPDPEEVVISRDNEEDVELQAMFYLPKWNSRPPTSGIPGRDGNLEAILANVVELLSRSPPPLADLDVFMADSTRPPLPDPPQFHVSFTLDVDDDDDDNDDDEVKATDSDHGCSDTMFNVSPGDKEGFHHELPSVKSPTWDEVFDDKGENKDSESENHEQPVGERKETAVDSNANAQSALDAHQVEDSIDLFDDDDAFLQLTIPDVHTPEGDVTPRTSPRVEAITNRTLDMLAHLPTSDAGIKKTAASLSSATMSKQKGNESPTLSKSGKSFDGLDFVVNFDLGYSMEDSEEEDDAVSLNTALPRPQNQAPLPRSSNPSTPYSFHSPAGPSHSNQSRFSTPVRLPGRKWAHPVSLLTSKSGPLPSPVASPSAAGPAAIGLSLSILKRRRREDGPKSPVETRDERPIVSDSEQAACSVDSDDDVVHKKRLVKKVNPLSSPEAASTILSDADSPIVRRKRVTALNTSGETEADEDDDFQADRGLARKRTIQPVHQINTKRTNCRKVRQFLDDQAVLSDDEGGAVVSSDEEDGEEQNCSLEGFVVDNAHLSQGLNESEMQGIYLKSLRSPTLRGRFKMSYRNRHNTDIFSQVPEQDESYKEDSFVVGSQEEEEEKEEEESSEEDLVLMPEDSYVDGRRQYATRRHVFLRKARAKNGTPGGCRAKPRNKRGRVLRLVDSSEDEEQADVSDTSNQQKTSSSSVTSEVSLLSRRLREEQQQERCRQRIENQHALSDQLDFDTSDSHAKKQPQEPPTTIPDPDGAGPSVAESPVCIVVDSRCLAGGVELVTGLRQRHGATVHVCSLDGGYFIVSARTAVERHPESELASLQNRKRLAERVSSLQERFERVCFIVEKDRTKPGDASRPFQRTHCYDSTLVALVRIGVRLLWSDDPAQSAALLVELAQLERRKGQAFAPPSSEVSGQRWQQALQLYLSIPAVNYVHALNLSRHFGCVAQFINSSVESIAQGGGMSAARAEQVYHFLRYNCDTSLVENAGNPRETGGGGGRRECKRRRVFVLFKAVQSCVREQGNSPGQHRPPLGRIGCGRRAASARLRIASAVQESTLLSLRTSSGHYKRCNGTSRLFFSKMMPDHYLNVSQNREFVDN